MDEIMNNGTNSWYSTTSTGDSNSITFTASTNVADTWFPYYMESTWVPYPEEPYKPEWHILQGYKKQFKSMWD